MKKLLVFLVVALFALVLSGCYLWAAVDPSEVGVQLDDGISISRVVGSGRYNSGGWYSSMRIVDLSVKTIQWEDPDLVTSDKQPIGLKLALSYHRSPNTECVTKMYKTYNAELFDNKRLETLVVSRIPNSAKENTAKLTLDQMLTARAEFAGSLTEDIGSELNKVCVVLDTVQVANIAPDEGYMAKLKQKAQVIQDREIAAESVKTAEENVKKTKAETEIQLELARRQNLINQELAKTYDISDRYYELTRLDKIASIMAAGTNAKWVFVPQGSGLSFIDAGDGNLVPVPSAPTK